MSTRAKQILRLFLRMSIAVVLLVWVFAEVDFTQFRRTVTAARWEYLAGVWTATALFYWVQSVALQWILRKQDCAMSLHGIFGASAVTSLYSLILPGFLSTGVKWYILKRATGKGTHALSSMLYNQLTLTLVMIAVGLTGLIVTNPTRILFPEAQRTWVLPLVCGLALAALALVSVLVVDGRTGGAALRSLADILKFLPRGLREKGGEMLTQIAVFQSAGWRFHLTIGLINVADGLLVGLLMYFFAARAAAVVVPLGVLVWLCAIVFVLGKIPISIANLGVREVTLVALLAGYGVGRSEALLMSMILFSSLIFMAALGVLYQLVWALQSRKPTSAEPEHLS
jgi:uncharacterized membrane protein YbhN (UPF0104 family)